MSLKKPAIIGGGVAIILWLLTRKSDAATEEQFQVDEKHDLDAGTIESTVRGGDTTLVDVGFTMHDEETGECTGSDAFGGAISCQEHDKRLLAAMVGGGVGSEANV